MMELELPAEETSDIDANDPASKEFRRLKREIGLLRIAVETLVDEPAKLVIPDYTDTLSEIRETIQQMADDYEKLCDTPSLSVTPEQLAAKINAASTEARKVERQSLQNAENSFVNITRELSGFVESARTADKQNKWMLGFGSLCFLAGGIVAWAVF
jgi:hypothetical protein